MTTKDTLREQLDETRTELDQVLADRDETRTELDQVQADRDETRTDLESLIDTVKRNHEEEHTGVFRYCTNPVCNNAGLMEFDREERCAL